jgi:hypothetical protein
MVCLFLIFLKGWRTEDKNFYPFFAITLGRNGLVSLWLPTATATATATVTVTVARCASLVYFCAATFISGVFLFFFFLLFTT